MSKEKAWKGKTHGGDFGQKCLFFYFKYGNITLSYAVMSVVIFFYLVINVKVTKNIFHYFRRRHKYGFFKSVISTYQNHFLFGKTLIDKFAIFAGRRDEYIVEEEGREYFYEMVNSPNTGAIFLNSHVGCAEIAGYLLSQKTKKFNAVVFGGEAPVMQGYRTKTWDEQNVNMIPVSDSFSHIFAINNALNNNELISMAADRVYEGSKNLKVDFFRSPASFPIASFQLAVKMKVPMLALFVMQEGNKKYHSYVYKLEVDNLATYTQQQQIELLMKQYVLKLECMMKRYPLQWYNFYEFWT